MNTPYELNYALIESPLGKMMAVADMERLHLLSFFNETNIEEEIGKISAKLGTTIRFDENKIINSIKDELKGYFSSKIKSFQTPISLHGTPFQQKVWKQLQKVPYGETLSYAGLAEKIGKPTAFRAVANANGANQLIIVVPCHRIIASGGGLGGYGAGLDKKKWLLNHENRMDFQ